MSPTVFESLDDAGVRTAGTTYLIYRGRFTSTRSPRRRRWPESSPRPCSGGRSRGRRSCSMPIIYASRARPGAVGQLGMPGISRPAHRLRRRSTWSSTTCSTSCSSRCPTTTRIRTSNGPHAQVTSTRGRRPAARAADACGRRSGRVPRASTRWSSALTIRRLRSRSGSDLVRAFEDFERRHAQPRGARPAVSWRSASAQRSAMVYALDPDRAPTQLIPRAIEAVTRGPARGSDPGRCGGGAAPEGVIVRVPARRDPLRAAAETLLTDLRGERSCVQVDGSARCSCPHASRTADFSAPRSTPTP